MSFISDTQAVTVEGDSFFQAPLCQSSRLPGLLTEVQGAAQGPGGLSGCGSSGETRECGIETVVMEIFDSMSTFLLCP